MIGRKIVCKGEIPQEHLQELPEFFDAQSHILDDSHHLFCH